MAVPLLGPDIPPLTDLPGHVGRYRVQLDIDRSPLLQRYFDYDWALIGNLGVDLLVEALAPLLGLERAVKAIVLAIPPLTAAGMLLVAREVHGRVPPTAFWALPLAYGYPLMFGFVNFALSMALALLALGLWLRFDRFGRHRLRAVLFIPISLLLWLAHVFGWGVLGAAAYSAEVVRAWDRGARPLTALWRGGVAVLPLTPPFLLMLLWRSDGGGGTGDLFNWTVKAEYLRSVLRDRWEAWDLISLGLLVLLTLAALAHRRIGWSRNLAASAMFLIALFACLPRIIFGSAYADMRLAPFAVALVILAIRLKPDAGAGLGTALAAGGLLFLGARLAGNTASFALFDAAYGRELAAISHLPRGATVAAFVGRPCPTRWLANRLDHLPSLAIARREAFANDQWAQAGAQLIQMRFPEAGRYTVDPSQLVTAAPCANGTWWTVERSLAHLPRGVFSHVWLIAPPRHDAGMFFGLRPLWRSGTSVLYEDRRPAPPAP